MKKRTRWLLAGGFSLLLLVVFLLIPASPPSFPIPDPNGYDDFVKAADLVRAGYTNVPSLLPNDPAVRTWVSGKADVVARVKAGLSKPCRVPIRIASGVFTNAVSWGIVRL
jgi:hypothetical protein